MRLLIALLLTFVSLTSFGQRGNYFVAHFTPGLEHNDNVSFDIVQDQRGVMYFATRAGVLEFDGKNWDLLKRKAAVFSLQTTPGGEIFWSGANGFGKIDLDGQGFQQLVVLKDSTNTDIFHILAISNQVYFLSDETIYIYDQANSTIREIYANRETGIFTNLIELFGAVYANTEGGLYQVTEKLTRSKLGLTGDVVFCSRLENNYLIGTTDNKVFVCNESMVLTPVKIQDQEYADASVIVSGKWVNRQLLALGTLRGGVMFINPITGRTEEIVNYKTGLPDNEVYAMTADHNENIWVAHDYGFSRISPDMPFRSFSHYRGLEGNLLCAYATASSVYVGTSLGLFTLEKEDIYDELVYFVNVEIPGSTQSTKAPAPAAVVAPVEEVQQTESKKRGFFGFLKKNRRKPKEEAAQTATQEESTTTPATTPPQATNAPRFRKEKRVQKILRESQYLYKKVPGIDSKITNLVEVNGQLIASGLDGIFAVSGMNATPLLREPIHYLYASRSENILFASTYDDHVRTLVFESNKWQQIDLLNHIDDQINFMFEGDERDLWLCGIDNIYKYEITDYNVNPVLSIGLTNSDAERTVGISFDGKILFANTEGFFTLNSENTGLVTIDSLAAPVQFFAKEGSMVYRGPHGWGLIGKTESHPNLKLLNLFKDLRFVTTDEPDHNLWMISGSNELYKFFTERVAVNYDAFPLFLKSVSTNVEKKGFEAKISITEENSAVTFEIVQPDYVSPEAIEFRYMLEGMTDVWSDWSAGNSAISFPFLPPADYTLRVQAKNIFGKVTDLNPYHFKVLPPYWKRSWFYAMEFAILAGLVILSFRLNARYRFVSRVLTMLTIILLIQFVQALLDSTIKFGEESPVINFIIQVIVALMILPVEGFLRNLMFRSLDASGKFYRFINSKTDPEVVEKSEELETTDKH